MHFGSKPLSCILYDDGMNEIEGKFYGLGGTVTCSEDLLSLVKSVAEFARGRIMISIKRALDELDDTISYGQMNCKEWLMRSKLKEQTV